MIEINWTAIRTAWPIPTKTTPCSTRLRRRSVGAAIALFSMVFMNLIHALINLLKVVGTKQGLAHCSRGRSCRVIVSAKRAFAAAAPLVGHGQHLCGSLDVQPEGPPQEVP